MILKIFASLTGEIGKKLIRAINKEIKNGTGYISRNIVSCEDGYTVILVDIPTPEVRHEKKMYTTIPLGIILKKVKQ